MRSFRLKDILGQIGGEVVQGNRDLTIEKVATRFKGLRDHTLFLDMRGQAVDLPLLRKHHSYAVVTNRPEKFVGLGKGVTVIRVAKPVNAYWGLVKYYRSLFNIPVIGITGTCGKTTVKDMVKHILHSQYKVQATHRSRNDSAYNLKYLLGINADTEVGVIEMGLAYPGDILRCCRYFRPEVGVITRIGVDHLLGCKSLEGYIKGKAELLKGMSYTGTLILNADDKNIRKIDLSPFKGKIIYFGINRRADFRASRVRYFEDGMKYKLCCKGQTYSMFVPGLGIHNVYNALAAIVAVSAIGFDVPEAGSLLSEFQHLESHLQIKKGFNGCTIIDDTWSTNPTSIQAALEVLRAVGKRKKTIAILGYIDELGEHSRYHHAKVGEAIAGMGINMLVTVGEKAKVISERALQKGMNKKKVISCEKPEQVFEAVSPYLNERAVVLVKKSMHVSCRELMKQLLGEK